MNDNAARGESVKFAQWHDAALLFFVLAHLDLGADAANLFDPRLPARPWTDGLLAAYRRAPCRLAAHGVALHHPHRLREALASLAGDDALSTEDRSLWLALTDAVQAERRGFAPQFGPRRDEILEPLNALRCGLWERIGVAPPLTIVDCPALGRAGRAIARGEQRIIAVSLAEPTEHVLCQVLHEDIHAVTDPAIAAQWSDAGPDRDTAAGSPGFSRHQELEVAAVEVGDALIRSRAPEWNDAYRRWRTRMGG